MFFFLLHNQFYLNTVAIVCLISLIVLVLACTYVWTLIDVPDDSGIQERASDPLQIESRWLWDAVWILSSEPLSSERAAICSESFEKSLQSFVEVLRWLSWGPIVILLCSSLHAGNLCITLHSKCLKNVFFKQLESSSLSH